jgi:hypothetical protein
MAKQLEINTHLTDQQAPALEAMLTALTYAKIRELGLDAQQTNCATSALYFLEKRVLNRNTGQSEISFFVSEPQAEGLQDLISLLSPEVIAKLYFDNEATSLIHEALSNIGKRLHDQLNPKDLTNERSA